MEPDTERDIDALYDLAPEEFIAARDALVKRLRGQRRRDDANAVKALRRPSVAAWAVNQVARRHPEAVDDLLDAGARLTTAQRRLLSGVKDAGMQAAAGRRRALIDQAWTLAAAVLEEQGSAAATQRPAVVGTLEAASVDPEAGAAVRAGRLTAHIPAPSDFGAVSGFALVGGDDTEPAPDEAQGDDPEQQRRRLLQAQAHQAAQHADLAERKAGDARQAAMKEAADAERAQRQADEAARRAQDAAQAAQAAQARADDLERAAAQARREAEDLAGQLDALA